jgi:DNA-directed RNA polymerase III subunit RPC11
MWFCPCDGTLLQIRTSAATLHDAPPRQQQIWFCPTCPYSCAIAESSRTTTTAASFGGSRRRKKAGADDVLGGAAAWENVDRTTTSCPSCSHKEAYFLQMQIRSADEPMSIFYKCCQCSHQWNDR